MVDIEFVYEHADHVKTYKSDGYYYIELTYKGDFNMYTAATWEYVWHQAANWLQQQQN